ncbi:hypothetical protein OSB04_012917 [Centaurea solstitialis]|uniref:Peptidase S10, serine carboxypeptidase, Alpha/Beta hydrolase fold protein n=1 Tax=Centaurea solstitialis TaxID=347529 RepID=A0AA38TJS2_9ASTR|nr:hypothetical protein OSB04_012917 [Centaurea solstitialis]
MSVNVTNIDDLILSTAGARYIGVGEDEEIQLFYYFVESERNPSNDPLLFYITGGPGTGTTGLYPFIYQIGPVIFNLESSWKNNITLELNPNSWSKAANVIIIDIRVGVGFSYAKRWEASRSSDSIVTLHSYEFLKKWLLENPRFVSNPLYISGTSYMGIIVPNVALQIYNDNERGNQPQLNIKGCLIVSPLTDKFMDFNSRIEAAHRFALISDDIYKATKETCHGNYIHNDPENTLCSKNLERVDECIDGINFSNILEPLCEKTNMKPYCREAANIFLEIWGNDKDVQKALNVREKGIDPAYLGAPHLKNFYVQGIIEKWEYTNTSINYDLDKEDTIYYSYDIYSSIADHQQLLTKNCQVLIICGDHDLTFPCVGTEKWITSLNLSIESQWEPWFVRKQVAGYQMTYAQRPYSLKFATIKGAGHSVALYKPKEAFVMMDRWFASHTYSSGSYLQY